MIIGYLIISIIYLYNIYISLSLYVYIVYNWDILGQFSIEPGIPCHPEVVLSDRSGPVLESLQGNMHLNPDSGCLQCIPT